MSGKRISLSEETYDRLERVKKEEESFGDVIDRLVGVDDRLLYDLVGEDVEAVRERSSAFRADVDGRSVGDRNSR